MAARTIFRYRIPITDRPVVKIHGADYSVLSVGPARDGRDALDMWAIVDPDAAPVDVSFRVVGTGHVIGDREYLRWIGTAPHHGGALIFHVFEIVGTHDETDADW